MEQNEKKTSPVAAVPFPGAGGRGFGNYIEAIYDAAQQARTAQLEQAYAKAEADLAQAKRVSDDAFSEGVRRLDGLGQQTAASFREVANARGLNTGATGQAALMMANAMQNDRYGLERARGESDRALDKERRMLEVNFEAQKQQLIAENQSMRNMALYDEAVRMDEVNRQQRQFETQMNLQQLQMAIAQRRAELEAAAKAAKTKNTTYNPAPEAAKFVDYEDAVTYLNILGVEGRPLTKEQWEFQKHSGSRPNAVTLYDDYESYLTDYVEAKLS